MTASSTVAQEFDIDRLVRRALQLAGLLDAAQGAASPNWTAWASMARDFLEADVEHLQTLGLLQRSKDFYEVETVAGTDSYTLASDTLDVFGVAMYRDSDDIETSVQPVDQDRYHRITDKTTPGAPTLYFAQRGASFVVRLWPVPDADNLGTLIFQRHGVLPTMTEGSATPAFERHWNEYFMYSLAHKLALHAGQPLQRAVAFEKLATVAMTRAKSASVGDYTDTYLRLAHRTGWT